MNNITEIQWKNSLMEYKNIYPFIDSCSYEEGKLHFIIKYNEDFSLNDIENSISRMCNEILHSKYNFDIIDIFYEVLKKTNKTSIDMFLNNHMSSTDFNSLLKWLNENYL
ncbi:Uncharacterised protein [uncultured Clostridium sp.]|nr:Uncharacterised protein [uncultured Clostridium sp.]